MSPPARQSAVDRREQILDAAVDEFHTSGYNRVGIEQILGRLGLSGPALYHHFPNKYSLLREGILGLLDKVDDALDSVPEQPDDPLNQLAEQVAIAGELSVANPSLVSVTVWDSRDLTEADAELARTRRRATIDRFGKLVGVINPTWSEESREVAATTLAAAAFTAGHDVPVLSLPDGVSGVLRKLAIAVATTPLSSADPPTTSAVAGIETQSVREQLLRIGVREIVQHGYHKVTLDDLANRAGITTSGVYRYFDSKADLLESAIYRSNELIADNLAQVLATSATPQIALNALSPAYADLAFRQTDLITLTLSEIRSLGQRALETFVRQRRSLSADWCALVTSVYPEIPPADASLMIRATTFGIGHSATYFGGQGDCIRRDLGQFGTAMLNSYTC